MVVAVQIIISTVVSLGIAFLAAHLARRTAKKVATESRVAARHERALEGLASTLTVELARLRLETGKALNQIAAVMPNPAEAIERTNEAHYHLTLTVNLMKTVIRYQVLRVGDERTSELYENLMTVVFDEEATSALVRRVLKGEQVREMPGEDELVALVAHVEELVQSL